VFKAWIFAGLFNVGILLGYSYDKGITEEHLPQIALAGIMGPVGLGIVTSFILLKEE
jgi:hypothetical protein